ncbi:serine/threonine-protein kinase [Polyangium mundeleinium]|uniref:Serine/threonine-protein kinase n=1 Tax=Polyangium mundeleinium TaxID=2995306 RepID=A0ABT5EY03_9BACT|nr:serine/threonine-protein kinase [Polyangium mundeleinium]MDC0746719.1 serine/threonine-protein kinase [Polyangium mundeleinium]
MPSEIDAAGTLKGSEDLAHSHAEERARSGDPALASTIPLPANVDTPPPDDEAPGRVLEDRYTLVRRIGGGAHGDVWAADDRILGERVALKWMRVAHGSMLARIRREITTLRMLRFPGVVRLLDDGVADGRPFLVMEFIEGRPFPGVEQVAPTQRLPWQTLASPTLALLETLAHVHAAGVVHRDLKPENVLVRPDGRPVVLDFGISQLHAPGSERLTGAGQIVGTPLYVAPEQILARTVDARTDLYAIGVMLYESLTGRVPHETPDVPSMLRARLVKPARPLLELAPDLPPVLGAVIDRLLAARIEDRFDSAADVLAALRGESMYVSATLPWLGSRNPVLEMVQAARAGRSIDIVGPRGSGRSRCMHEASEELTAAGFSALWTRPSRAPLGSLHSIVGEPPGGDELRLDGALAHAESALKNVLGAGTVLFADDAERLDPWSAEILGRHPKGPGVVIRAVLLSSADAWADGIVMLPPLDEASLVPLFAGPDRLFHLREDAARILWERTDGLPARIEAELVMWTRLGLARREGGAFVVDRDALGRLQAGLASLPGGATAAHDLLDDDVHVEETRSWLSLAGRPMTILQLARVMRCAPWRVEAACNALLSLGAVKHHGADRFEGRGRIYLPWSEQQRVEAHRALAGVMQPGDEGRLHHLLASGLVRESAREAVDVAHRHAVEGDLGAATAALAEGLRAARELGSGPELTEILSTWAQVAFAGGAPRALDRVLYELSRLRDRDAELGRIEALLRAGIAAPGAGALKALEMADDIGSFSDPELERRRQRIRIVAVAARASSSLIAEVLEEIEAWAEDTGHPLALLCLAEGRALLRYHEGRFQEAAALHAQAAALEPWTTGRIAAMLNSASALLEAFQHDKAALRASEAQALAARCRNPYWEGRAEWLARSAKYRTGQTQGPDFELVDAIARVGALDLEALVCLNEGAAAMRAGARDAGAALADRAATIWRGMGRPFAAMLARALALACGATADAGEVQALAERAMNCKGPGVGIQTLGLLGPIAPEAREQWRDAIAGLVRDVPEASWDQRMDVLSVHESLDGLLHRR